MPRWIEEPIFQINLLKLRFCECRLERLIDSLITNFDDILSLCPRVILLSFSLCSWLFFVPLSVSSLLIGVHIFMDWGCNFVSLWLQSLSFESRKRGRLVHCVVCNWCTENFNYPYLSVKIFRCHKANFEFSSNSGGFNMLIEHSFLLAILSFKNLIFHGVENTGDLLRMMTSCMQHACCLQKLEW